MHRLKKLSKQRLMQARIAGVFAAVGRQAGAAAASSKAAACPPLTRAGLLIGDKAWAAAIRIRSTQPGPADAHESCGTSSRAARPALPRARPGSTPTTSFPVGHRPHPDTRRSPARPAAPTRCTWCSSARPAGAGRPSESAGGERRRDGKGGRQGTRGGGGELEGRNGLELPPLQKQGKGGGCAAAVTRAAVHACHGRGLRRAEPGCAGPHGNLNGGANSDRAAIAVPSEACLTRINTHPRRILLLPWVRISRVAAPRPASCFRPTLPCTLSALPPSRPASADSRGRRLGRRLGPPVGLACRLVGGGGGGHLLLGHFGDFLGARDLLPPRRRGRRGVARARRRGAARGRGVEQPKEGTSEKRGTGSD